jgi:hypothetical protein
MTIIPSLQRMFQPERRQCPWILANQKKACPRHQQRIKRRAGTSVPPQRYPGMIGKHAMPKRVHLLVAALISATTISAFAQGGGGAGGSGGGAGSSGTGAGSAGGAAAGSTTGTAPSGAPGSSVPNGTSPTPAPAPGQSTPGQSTTGQSTKLPTGPGSETSGSNPGTARRHNCDPARDSIVGRNATSSVGSGSTTGGTPRIANDPTVPNENARAPRNKTSC